MTTFRVEQNGAILVPHNFGATVSNVAVRVVRDDGTQLVPTTTNVQAVDLGEYAFQITPEHTGILDWLRLEWTATVGGVARSDTDTVEVAGGVLFSVADIRAMSTALADPAKVSDGRILEMRTTVEQAIENELNYALVPRYDRFTVSGEGTTLLRRLPNYTRRILGVSWTQAGVTTTLAPTEIAGLTLTASGFVTGGYTWSLGSTVTLTLEHGLDRPPEPLRMAAKLLAKSWLIPGPIDDRANSFASADGGTYGLAMPGSANYPFGVPIVDSLVNANRHVTIA